VTIVYVHSGVSGLERPVADLSAFVTAGTTQRSCLDAAEHAVRELEDDPRFNAGFGSVLSNEGGLEMDAGIIAGATGRFGGVANVTVRHPISLARRVMEQTPHVLITGQGASDLGRDMEQLADTTEEERRRWEEARSAGTLDASSYGSPEHVDTVGAITLDEAGELAAASSTGGVFGKLPGRVGDSPVLGAGLYASAGAAVLGTGVGELFLETTAAFRAGALIENGATPQEACEEIIRFIGTRSEATAGLMALNKRGDFGAAYRGGSWAVAGPQGNVAVVRVG
jgi:beta-aspartyl-peptidase (threonine type)